MTGVVMGYMAVKSMFCTCCKALLDVSCDILCPDPGG